MMHRPSDALYLLSGFFVQIYENQFASKVAIITQTVYTGDSFTGHMSETRRLVVATSLSGSAVSFSLTGTQSRTRVKEKIIYINKMGITLTPKK